MASSSDPAPTLAQIAQTIFDDALHNILHDLVLHQHRAHKMLLADLDPTTKLPHCASCTLPRILDPPLAPKVRGSLAEPLSDTQYCERRPWSRRPGHDIYDNPFPRSDATGRPVGKKDNAKSNGKNPDSENATQNGGSAPPSPSAEPETAAKLLEKGEKKASKIDEKLKKGEYVPWHTCPSCKRSLLITRFAKHLEQCMGLSGRQASRNAMVKMGGGTPVPGNSRGGTPNPGGDEDGEEEAEVEGKGKEKGGVRKKLLKKGIEGKMRKQKAENGVGKVGKGGGGKKGARPSPAPSSIGEGKREREEGEEDDGDEVHVKKRQKLQRVGSVASVTSSSLFGAEMERTESFEGSFVEEGSDGKD
nr:hypothetical protein B0A51_15935 [Rachicladosporium sp. CCFEE 5018]